MPAWTDQQLEAIYSGRKKIICSAAAGSGKTAVMIERVVRMLREGADPEAFLVVTFTNAAASEMKEKIRRRLYEERSDRNLRLALEKMDMMEISTIHSFCQTLIRREFQAAKVDPFFRICPAGVGKKLFQDAFRAACNQLMKDGDPDYAEFRKRFDRTETEEMAASLYRFMMSLPEPEQWLENACGNIPLTLDMNHPWFQTISEMMREKIASGRVLLRRMFDMFSEPEHIDSVRVIWKADEELFHVKQLWADGHPVTADELNRPFVRFTTPRNLNRLELDWKERYGDLRARLKKICEEMDGIILPDPEKAEREFTNMRESLQALKKIMLLTAENFEDCKSRRRVLDFNDLEHKAYGILKDPACRESVQSRWKHIFVDECQDVSSIQDALIQALTAPDSDLFMVGDVKQSIYRFRRANPRLFNDRKAEYRSDGSEGAALALQTNFRSRPEILETANTVFRDVMRVNTAEMDYTPDEELLPGKAAEGFVPVNIDLIQPDGSERIEQLADYVTMRVKEQLAEGKRCRDMVILMPIVSGDGGRLAEALGKRQVPVFFDGGAEFYELEEIRAFILLLQLIENPLQDTPLISVLKNAPFWFSEEELARVRLCSPGKDVPFWQAFRDCSAEKSEIGRRCREAREKIDKWREKEKVTLLPAFLFELLSDSHLYAAAGIRSTGKTAQRNLRILCGQAEEAQNAGIYTLRDFLSFLSEQASGSDQKSASPLADGDDVVRIMTMHKSKGLQFPVVFCLGLDKEFRAHAESRIGMHEELGITLYYKQPAHRLARKTAADQVFSWKKDREEKAEKIRLLYVAMTRAQEKMYLAGITEERSSWKLPAGEYRVRSARDFLDWIMPALIESTKESTGCAQDRKPWNITLFETNQQKTVENNDSFHSFSEWLDSMLSAPYVDELWTKEKEEPAEEKPERMVKKSVTSLLKQAEQEIYGDGEDEETPEDKRIPERFSRALKKYAAGKYPAFMMPQEEHRGAWRGTAVHRFLSLVDLERIRRAGDSPEAVLEEMKREMCGKGILSADESGVIPVEDAAKFFTSGIGRRVLASPEVRREWGFNLCREEQNMILQGVIDCAFREGGSWIILDYKTDSVSDPSPLADTYRPQLEWYATALEKLSGIPVKEKWLYSLHLNTAIQV